MLINRQDIRSLSTASSSIGSSDHVKTKMIDKG